MSSFSALDTGHTAFLLVSMALVNLMTPGLAFFYGGLVRKSSVLAIMMQSYISMGIITMLWVIVGFSLCFGKNTTSMFGDPSSFPFLMNVGYEPLEHNIYGNSTVFVEDVPGLVFAGYQGMFAVITPPLMSGAFADRMQFGPYIIFIVSFFLFIYCPFCHMVWGVDGVLGVWGVCDFAGGIVVHITAGFAALAAVIFLGPRTPTGTTTQEDMETPHNIPFVVLGTGLLWFGWFGFNAGSSLGVGLTAAYAAINSEIAASVALFTWTMLDWYFKGKPSIVGLCVGAVAGLATVTPAAGFIQPWAAFVIGLVAACFCYFCCYLKEKWQWDDALDVWGVHGMGGFIGTVLVGILADEKINGVQGSPELFLKQIVGASFAAVYSFGVSYGTLYIIDRFMKVRIEDEHTSNIDKNTFGEEAYYDEFMADEGQVKKLKGQKSEEMELIVEDGKAKDQPSEEA